MTENRIDRTLQALKQQGKKALIPFVTAGHGGYDRTEQLVLQMEKAGADIIELGVPFSDPIAEGPVIQHASEQALKQGTTLAGIFELVKRLRKKTDMPLLLMMYLNCDGVIVGSAIVNMVEQYQEQAPEKVYEFVKSLRTALDE